MAPIDSPNPKIEQYFRRQLQEEVKDLRCEVEELRMRLRTVISLLWKIPLTGAIVFLVYWCSEGMAENQDVPFLNWLALSYWSGWIQLLLCILFLGWAVLSRPHTRWRYWFIVEIPQVWMFVWLRYAAGNNGRFWGTNGSLPAFVMITLVYTIFAAAIKGG
jgi:hypothetical protein